MSTHNLLTFFPTITIFIGQSVSLYFMLSKLEFVTTTTFLVLDGLSLLLIILNHKPSLAASGGGVIWLVYSWSLVAKLVCISRRISDPLENWTLKYSNAIPLSCGLLCTPLIYAFLTVRSIANLYVKGSRKNEKLKMFHVDLTSHVIIDLLDINYALLLTFYNLTKANTWVTKARDVTAILGIVMHSFSFPTNQKSVKGPKDILRRRDIFLTRNYAALIGMLFIDIPLLIIRIYYWLSSPGASLFDAFMIKNIIFIPIQTVRLRECRLIEKDEHTRDDTIEADRRFDAVDDDVMDGVSSTHSTVALQDKTLPHFFKTSNPKLRRREGSIISQNPIVRFEGPNDEDREETQDSSTPDMLKKAVLSERRNSMNAPECFFVKDVNGFNNPLDRLDESNNEEPSSDLTFIMSELKESRKLPLSGFRVSKVFVKLWQCMLKGGSHGFSCLADETLTFSYIKQVRLAFPLLLHFIAQLAIVFVTAPYVLESPLAISGISETTIPVESYVGYLIAFGSCILMTIGNYGLAPGLDVAFVSFFYGLRMISFVMTFQIFRDTRTLELLALREYSFSWICPTIFFALIPLLDLLRSSYVIICSLCGRNHIYGFTPTAHHEAIVADVLDTKLLQYETASKERQRFVTTASVLVLLNCFHMIAPLSFGELLVGPDMIKNVRVMDHLLMRSWCEFVVLVFLKVFSVALFYDWPYCIVFGVHIILHGTYVIIGQAIRLIALRRCEVKVMFEHLLKEMAAETRLQQVDNDSNIPRFIALADVARRYDTEGFFSAPGCLMPSVI